jgi:hypothetical protein
MSGVDIWNQINESVRTVVWPLVVLLGLLLFRAKLGDVVQRLREADTPIGMMKFDPTVQLAANREIAESASSLVSSVQAEIDGLTQSSGESGELAGVERSTVGISHIKGDIEEVITASFIAGFEASKSIDARSWRMTHGGVPSPIVQWDDSVPRVVGYAVRVQDHVATRRALAAAAEATEKVDELGILLDGVFEKMRAEVESARQEGNDEKARSVQEALDDGIRLRDELLRRSEDLKVRNSRLEGMEISFGLPPRSQESRSTADEHDEKSGR